MGITEYNNYLKNKRDDNMVNKMVQGPSEKEAKKIYDIEKTMALTIFKKYYPDAVIDFKEAEIIEAPIVEPEEPKIPVPTKEELKALEDEVKRLADEKAAKKAELEAQLKALDES